MLKTFPIEFVRIALLQTLLEEHNKNNYFFGGDNQINLFSFYEQVKSQEEVDRFNDTFRDLTRQQNRMDLIGNGVIISPENPTITNLYSSLIVPMTWVCSIRTKLSNRDQMIQTINNLISELKGSKVDMAQLECVDENGQKYYKPFKVGTIGHGEEGVSISNGDYIGDFDTEYPSFDELWAKIYENRRKGVSNDLKNGDCLYFKGASKLKVGKYINEEMDIDFELEQIWYEMGGANGYLSFVSKDTFTSVPMTNNACTLRFNYDDTTLGQIVSYDVVCSIDEDDLEIDNNGKLKGTMRFSFESPLDFSSGAYILDTIDPVENPRVLDYIVVEEDADIIVPEEHTSFEKYKLSLSFDAIRCDEPATLNGNQYCQISFGGSATLVNSNTKLGNDLVKVSIEKNKLVGAQTITYESPAKWYVEPLELPSGNNANTVVSQLASNNFKQNTHTDGISLNIQYSFVADDDNTLLKQLFDYGRYGTFDTEVSPNMVYQIIEWWSSWGNVEKKAFLGKIVESVNIENTESDTLTLGISFQVQGENN